MNRQELVEAVEKEAGFEASIVDAVLGYAMYVIAETVTKGEVVQLRGFGTFRSAKRAARSVRHPKTGKPLRVPATTVPVFKPGMALMISVAARKNQAKGVQRPWRALSIER